MCGIGGLLLSPDDLQRVSVDDMIKTIGLEIESRGRDATGVARLTASNRLRVEKVAEPATEFFKKHPQIAAGCRLALVHTRAATTGTPRVIGNNHPITSGSVTGIHNGIVSNDDALFARYKWNRAAEVDSEAIFTAINNLGWKEAMELLNGSIACAWHDMEKPGHLFVVRHSSNPVHIGISESGSVIFASTNAAVAKAAAVLGSTQITIDSIKEGVMCEFWIDGDGKLASDVQEFTPPKTIWSRSGSYEYEQGAWFPRGRSTSPAYTAPATTRTSTSSAIASEWDIGAEGYVLRKGDDVVYCPGDEAYEPSYGTLTHFGAKTGWCFVEFEFDFGISDEAHLPLNRLYPAKAWVEKGGPRKLELVPPIQLPRAPDVEADDFLLPNSTKELIDSIEEIFGTDALDLLPGYPAWLTGDAPGYEWRNDQLIEVDDSIIDVEEVD